MCVCVWERERERERERESVLKWPGFKKGKVTFRKNHHIPAQKILKSLSPFPVSPYRYTTSQALWVWGYHPKSNTCICWFKTLLNTRFHLFSSLLLNWMINTYFQWPNEFIMFGFLFVIVLVFGFFLGGGGVPQIFIHYWMGGHSC